MLLFMGWIFVVLFGSIGKLILIMSFLGYLENKKSCFFISASLLTLSYILFLRMGC